MNTKSLQNLKRMMMIMLLYVTSTSSFAQCNATFTVTPDSLLTSTFGFAPNEDFGLSYEWDFGDGGSSTDEKPSHTYVASGTYTVCLTITHCEPGGTCVTCTECTDIIIENVNEGDENHVSVFENKVQTSISVFPNPFTETIAITAGESYDNALVQLVSITGEVVLSNQVQGLSAKGLCQIDVRHLESGVYFLQVISNNESIGNVKIIKQ